MIETRREIIRRKALEILKNNPDGVRYSELIRQINKEFPEIPKNTIVGSIWDLDKKFPDKVHKPERGLFKIKLETDVPIKFNIKEEKFYQPFKDWLEHEMEEVTKAVILGGNKFKDKWGTPDVIGIRVRPIKHEPDIFYTNKYLKLIEDELF